MTHLSCFTPFKTDVASIPLPKKFTFPFYYEPHAIASIAATELQGHIRNQKEWLHDFGDPKDQKSYSIGKMFGVLVVQDQENNLGYLSAFSGKLAESNHHNYFVPPVYDMLKDDDFFTNGMKKLKLLQEKIKTAQSSEKLKASKEAIDSDIAQLRENISTKKVFIKKEKERRKLLRAEAKLSMTAMQYDEYDSHLNKESHAQRMESKNRLKEWRSNIEKFEKTKLELEKPLLDLREERKALSSTLQEKLFDRYTFLNYKGNIKSLNEIFSETPAVAGAGECAAPKLLQYAFLNKLHPVAMAEFWWGKSPKSSIRKHKRFYPSCKSKCQPILGYMLEGLDVDPDPMLVNPGKEKKLQVLFEDNDLIAIHKPEGVLSVPGKVIKDSVYTRIQKLFPNLSGPIILHRLDMSTSGIMLLARNKEAHKILQSQFMSRTFKKKYIALLSGEIKANDGLIALPLRTDLDNRPRQMVCHEYGKSAQTKWELIQVDNGVSKVSFFPITGRTHQLRVHSAHHDGLDCPIVGDVLYGERDERLFLQATEISFTHPTSKEIITIRCKAEF